MESHSHFASCLLSSCASLYFNSKLRSLRTPFIIKALNLYRKKTGSNNLFWIHLDKKVHTGAGLDGGSSSVATALWAEIQFHGFLATEKEHQEWSSEIALYDPFVLSQGIAYYSGGGEVVPFDILMVLLNPQQACLTAEVYKRLQLDQNVDPLRLLRES